MSLLILLRLAQVSLPPVLESWRSEPPEVLHELQEIFSQTSVYRNDEQLKRILRQGPQRAPGIARTCWSTEISGINSAQAAIHSGDVFVEEPSEDSGPRC